MIQMLVMFAALSIPSLEVKDLDAYGLSDLTVMSDTEGETVRGKGFSYSFSGYNVGGSLSLGGAGGSSSISGFGTASGYAFGGFRSEVN